MARLVRTKIIECGQEYTDIEMYYAPTDVRRVRGPRTGVESSEFKTERNRREAKKTFVRICKTNLSGGRFLTLTFAKEHRPATVDEAHKIARDYFEGVYDRCARRGIEARAVYVIEWGKKGGLHIHGFVNKEVPLGQLQKWSWGITCIRSVPANAEDIEQVADYMMKAPIGKGRHKWYKIGKLSEPVVTIDDKQVTSSEFTSIYKDGFREGDVLELVERIAPCNRIVHWDGYYCSQMESPYLSVSLEHRQQQNAVNNIDAYKIDTFKYDDKEKINGYSLAFLRRLDPDQRSLWSA